MLSLRLESVQEKKGKYKNELVAGVSNLCSFNTQHTAQFGSQGDELKILQLSSGPDWTLLVGRFWLADNVFDTPSLEGKPETRSWTPYCTVANTVHELVFSKQVHKEVYWD